jgi:hypothetical protein
MTDGDFWTLLMATIVARLTANGILWVLLIASGLVWCVPRFFFLRDNEELSGEKLAAINPNAR